MPNQLWLSFRKIWASYPPGAIAYGDEQAYSHLTGLMTLAIATSTGYAIAINQIPGAELVANSFLLFIGACVIGLIALVMNTKSRVADERQLRYDITSIWYGRLIQTTTIVLYLSFILFASNSWFPGQKPQRKDYTAAAIQCNVTLATNRAVLISPGGIFQDPALEDAFLVEDVRKWFSPLVGDGKRKQILIIDQYPAFDAAYNTFSCVMLFRETNMEFKRALVFLKRRPPTAGGGAIKYFVKDHQGELEHLRLPKTQSGRQSYPVISIPSPNEGDSLLVMVAVEAQDESQLGISPEWFQFNLRRVQQ